MAVYAVFQYFMIPDVTAGELFLRHLWHVITLGILIYALFWIVFRKAIVHPIRHMYRHLYGVGTGRMEEIRIASGIGEISSIADGINSMIRRMRLGLNRNTIYSCQATLGRLRAHARRLHGKAPEESEAILEQTVNLQHQLAALLREKLSLRYREQNVPDAPLPGEMRAPSGTA
jgi:methyl-accepting chemotaxis protein